MFILPPPLKNEDFYLTEDLTLKFAVNRDVIKLLTHAKHLSFPQPINHGRLFFLKTDIDAWIKKNNTFHYGRKQLIDLCKGAKTDTEKKVVTDEKMTYQTCFDILNQGKKNFIKVEDEKNENE